MRLARVSVLGALGLAIAIGCGSDPEGPPLIGGPPDAGSSVEEEAGCLTVDIKPLDPTTLPDCCKEAPAHCVPKDNVDPSLRKQFAECSGGYCEPDDIIKDPKFIPQECKSLNDAPGACVSLCVPQVQQYLSILPQGSCKPNERCAPCINPLDNTNTGACDVGKQKPASSCGEPDAGPQAEGGGPSCPYTGPPLIDPNIFPACTPACGGSHCVPSSLVPAKEQAQLTKCTGKDGQAGFCAPDSLSATGGNGIPPACTSVAGAEGRCLSTCIPLVASKANLLPKAGCGENERCAPCFDPTAADPTAPSGACSVACDSPKTGPTILKCPYDGKPLIDPKIFPACSPACGGAHCVPTDLVPVGQQSQLAKCPGGFCTPDKLSASGGQAVPKTCKSVANAEGRCLSTCLPLVASKANLLPKDNCDADERCVPCFDPTGTEPDVPTGACSVACDKPKDDPVHLACPYTGAPLVNVAVFPSCSPACGGAHCLPGDLIPAAQRSQLATCPGGYCAPDKIAQAANRYVPKTCQPFDDPASEGRCTSTCLPAVQSQKDQLVSAGCAGGELCAPCNDPFNGSSTGACNLACDAPTKQAFSFPVCCNYQGEVQGTCVPRSLIPASQASNLKAEACPTGNPADYLCVPKEYLPTPPPGYSVQTCTNPVLGSGTCVSQCANILAGLGNVVLGLLGPNGCPGNHVCVPCSVAPAGTPGCP
jgi:hypothetical protein